MEAVESDPANVEALAIELLSIAGKLKRRLREQASPGDFTPSQLSVVGRLEREGPSTVTTLARAEGMRPQSMGAIVAVLEEAGLVGGEAHPTDGRQTVLSLTPGCREMLRAGRAARQDWLAESIRTSLASEERTTLASAVALLHRLIDSPRR